MDVRLTHKSRIDDSLSGGVWRYRIDISDGDDTCAAHYASTLAATMEAADVGSVLRVTSHVVNTIGDDQVIIILQADLLEAASNAAATSNVVAASSLSPSSLSSSSLPSVAAAAAVATAPSSSVAATSNGVAAAAASPPSSVAAASSSASSSSSNVAATSNVAPSSVSAVASNAVASRPLASDVAERIARNRAAALARRAVGNQQRSIATQKRPIIAERAGEENNRPHEKKQKVAAPKSKVAAPARIFKRDRRMDVALGECLCSGVLSEIHGPAGVGKSQLAMTLGVEALIRDPNTRVLLIRTGASVTKRFLAIATARGLSSERFGRDLLTATAHDAPMLHAALETKNVRRGFLLVIVDSIADILRGVSSSSGKMSSAKDERRKAAEAANAVAAALKKMAASGQCAVLLVNQARADFNGNGNGTLPVSDAILAKIAKPRFSLSRKDGGGCPREITLATGDLDECGDKPFAAFTITDAGIAEPAASSGDEDDDSSS